MQFQQMSPDNHMEGHGTASSNHIQKSEPVESHYWSASPVSDSSPASLLILTTDQILIPKSKMTKLWA